DVEAAVLEPDERVEDVRDEDGRLAVRRERRVGGRAVLAARVDERRARALDPPAPAGGDAAKRREGEDERRSCAHARPLRERREPTTRASRATRGPRG